MALFRYKAVTSTGDTIEGEMEAPSRDDVVAKLQDAGHLALDAKEAAAGGALDFGTMFRRSPLAGNELNSFTLQLATLLAAGQPLDRALQILVELPDDESARKLIERVREAVRGGAPLSGALEAEHGVFSRLYVNMVRAGEISGSLHSTLKRLGEYLERSKALKDQVISAMIYPAILLTLVFAALTLLLVYVVPQFVPLFADLGTEL